MNTEPKPATSERNDIDYQNREIEQLKEQLAALEGVLADDTGKAALAAAIAEATKPLVEKITELEGRLSKYEQG